MWRSAHSHAKAIATEGGEASSPPLLLPEEEEGREQCRASGRHLFEREREKLEMAATSAKRPRCMEQHVLGEAVLAQWPAAGRNSAWHAAKVEGINADGTYTLSYEALARINPAVSEASIRSHSEPPPVGPSFRGQCASLALEISNNAPELRGTLAELCQAFQSSADIHAELRAVLGAIGAEDPGVSAVPPPPTEGAPRPSTRAPSIRAPPNDNEASTPPPKEVGGEVFLGNARSLSVPGPNLQAAQRLREQLAGVVESDQEGTPAAQERPEGGEAASAGEASGDSDALTTPSTLLASTFFMPEFDGADPAFKDFVMSRLKYNYGERDLQDRMIVNWVRSATVDL